MSKEGLREEDELKQKVVSGFKWLAMGKFLGQLINWCLSFWVIRLLAPSDYGLMAMASSFVAVLALFNEMGMGAALIQSKSLSHQMIRQVFGLTILVNLALFSILQLASPAIALFFAEDQLIPILRVLALQFVCTCFLIVPQALMDRNMDFKRKSMVDLGANLISGVLSLTLALKGQGVWSLVWASMALVALRTLGYNCMGGPFYLPSFDFRGMKSSLVFGGQVTLEKVVWYLYSQADVFIIGKILGKEALGFYSVGKHIASLPADKLMPIINQVIFPAFSRIQDDGKAVAGGVLKGITTLAILVFPVFWGLSSISHDLVPFVLGERWAPAVLPLLLISLVLPLRMVNSILISALKGIQRADITLQNALIPLVLMVPGYYLGTFWGVNGVSLSWALVYPVCFLICSIRASAFFLFSPGDVWLGFWGTLACSVAMYAGVILIRGMFSPDNHGVVLLGICVFTGATLYCLLQFLLNRERLKTALAFIR